jgi:isocitrate dehydrogenase
LHTADIFRAGQSRERVGTQAFAAAVIARLGQMPRQLPKVSFANGLPAASVIAPRQPQAKELDGVDIFLQSNLSPNELGLRLSGLATRIPLQMITNRGVKVWPNGHPETWCTDHWRCRFVRASGTAIGFEDVLAALATVHGAGFEVVKTEHLYRFDGEPGYSLGQGQ